MAREQVKLVSTAKKFAKAKPAVPAVLLDAKGARLVNDPWIYLDDGQDAEADWRLRLARHGRKDRRQRPERGAVDADRRITAQMRHEVGAHLRRGEGFERQPRGLDRAGGNDHLAIRRDRQEFPLASGVQLDGRDRVPRGVKLDDMGSRHEKQAPGRIRIEPEMAAFHLDPSHWETGIRDVEYQRVARKDPDRIGRIPERLGSGLAWRQGHQSWVESRFHASL